MKTKFRLMKFKILIKANLLLKITKKDFKKGNQPFKCNLNLQKNWI